MSTDVRVWLVREAISPAGATEPVRETLQDCFVLARSAYEAAEIVSEHEGRRIVRVEEVCPITQLPDDRYRVQPVAARPSPS